MKSSLILKAFMSVFTKCFKTSISLLFFSCSFTVFSYLVVQILLQNELLRVFCNFYNCVIEGAENLYNLNNSLSVFLSYLPIESSQSWLAFFLLVFIPFLEKVLLMEEVTNVRSKIFQYLALIFS